MHVEQLNLEPNDFLGRSVSSQSKAKYARNNNRLHHSSLLPSRGKHKISADKLLRCPNSNSCTYTKEHVIIAETRRNVFYGWGYFTVNSVGRNPWCEVIPDSKCTSNPNHVHIVFPQEFKSDRERLKNIAKYLALQSEWLEVRDPTVHVSKEE